MRSSSSTLRTTEAELEGSTRRTTSVPGQEIPGIVQGDSLLAYPTAAVRHRQQRVNMDFPGFCGHVNLTPIVALRICDGHEIQFGKNTASL
jgi:hypothetical protein